MQIKFWKMHGLGNDFLVIDMMIDKKNCDEVEIKKGEQVIIR